MVVVPFRARFRGNKCLPRATHLWFLPQAGGFAGFHVSQPLSLTSTQSVLHTPRTSEGEASRVPSTTGTTPVNSTLLVCGNPTVSTFADECNRFSQLWEPVQLR